MKFEYYWLAFDFTKEDMDKVDALGEDGWELIQIVPVHVKLLNWCAILKKRNEEVL